jgi:methyl-accepting chemotaxis protein
MNTKRLNMLRTLKDLALAMLNATLILIVLCLFLAWKIADKADQIAASFARNLITVEPLRQDIQGAIAEMATLSRALEQMSSQSVELTAAGLQQMQSQVEQINARMNTARQSITTLTETPTKLIDYAVDATADRLTLSINDLRGCAPPQT